jgi:hypothetical protein
VLGFGFPGFAKPEKVKVLAGFDNTGKGVILVLPSFATTRQAYQVLVSLGFANSGKVCQVLVLCGFANIGKVC